MTFVGTSHFQGEAMNQASKIGSFFMFPILVLLAHLIASQILHLYATFPNVDIPFHYIGGLSITYTSAQILLYLEEKNMIARLDRYIFLILIFSLTATAAVFWEFAEFIVDRLLDTNIQVSLANTMQDQFMGILGGMTWVLIMFKTSQVLRPVRS
jgi:hypothetical protein